MRADTSSAAAEMLRRTKSNHARTTRGPGAFGVQIGVQLRIGVETVTQRTGLLISIAEYHADGATGSRRPRNTLLVGPN